MKVKVSQKRELWRVAALLVELEESIYGKDVFNSGVETELTPVVSQLLKIMEDLEVV